MSESRDSITEKAETRPLGSVFSYSLNTLPPMYKDDWDENVFPLAYLITIRCYGTWLHGDERGSVDIHGKNTYGSPNIAPNKNLENQMAEKIKDNSFIFNEKQRSVVAEVINEICKVRKYRLLALNVRTNHVHAVINAPTNPEKIINAIKAYSTRRLRELILIAPDLSPWSRGGSRRYLWKQRHVDLAVDYVLYCQGDKPFEMEQ